MTSSTALPTPPIRSLRHAPVAVFTACVVTVACLAGYAWLRKAATPGAAASHAVQPATTADYGLIFEGYSWQWPEHLAATAMFQCAPLTSKDNRASVVVWTDKANHVIAFGPAQEGVKLAAFAAALGTDAAVDGYQSIHLAATGHVMRTFKKKNTLQLNDVKLDCIRTWDD